MKLTGILAILAFLLKTLCEVLQLVTTWPSMHKISSVFLKQLLIFLSQFYLTTYMFSLPVSTVCIGLAISGCLGYTSTQQG